MRGQETEEGRKRRRQSSEELATVWGLPRGCKDRQCAVSVHTISGLCSLTDAGPPGDPREKCPHPHHALPPSPLTPFYWANCANCPEVLNEEGVAFTSSLWHCSFLLFSRRTWLGLGESLGKWSSKQPRCSIQHTAGSEDSNQVWVGRCWLLELGQAASQKVWGTCYWEVYALHVRLYLTLWPWKSWTHPAVVARPSWLFQICLNTDVAENVFGHRRGRDPRYQRWGIAPVNRVVSPHEGGQSFSWLENLVRGMDLTPTPHAGLSKYSTLPARLVQGRSIIWDSYSFSFILLRVGLLWL